MSHESTPLRYHQCNTCHLIFMNPRPSQEWYNHLYQTEFWEVKQEKRNDRGRIENQITKEALWAEKLISVLDETGFIENRDNPKILEIGCAYGVIGKLISQYYRGVPFGVEPSDAARDFAEKTTGIHIFRVNMDQVIQTTEVDQFDLIIYSHVLENITDPLSALAAARRLLKPNGYILIDTPNNFLRRSWHIHHPYCFSLPSLQQLLYRANFDICTFRTWPRPKYVLGSIYLSVVARKTDNPSLSSMTALTVQLSRAFGYMFFNIFNRGPIGQINRLLGQRMFTLSQSSRNEIARILSEVQS